MKKSKQLSENRDPLERDLSNLLEKGEWKAVRFELEPKNKSITIRLSDRLLRAIKKRAKESGVEYQKFIRLALERVVGS